MQTRAAANQCGKRDALGGSQICPTLVPGRWKQACPLPHHIPRDRGKVLRKHLVNSPDLRQIKIQRSECCKQPATIFHIQHLTVHSEQAFLSPSWFPIYWDHIHFAKTRWRRRLRDAADSGNTSSLKHWRSFKQRARRRGAVNVYFFKYWLWHYKFVFITIHLNLPK